MPGSEIGDERIKMSYAERLKSPRRSRDKFRRNFIAIRCRANVAKCTLHDLRRSAITNWAQKLPIQVVQQLAGHSDISTTRKYYLTVRSEDMVSANKVLNDIFAKVKAD